MAIKILSVDDELDLEILLTQYFRRKSVKVNTNSPLPIMVWRLYNSYWRKKISILS